MAPPNEAGPQAAVPTATKTTTKIPDANSLKRDVDAVVSEVQDLGAKVSTEAQEQVSQLADQAQAKIAETAEKVKGVAGEQKDLLADRITGVAEAADRVATDLESNNQQAAQYVRMKCLRHRCRLLTVPQLVVENRQVDRTLRQGCGCRLDAGHNEGLITHVLKLYLDAHRDQRLIFDNEYSWL